MPVINYKKNFKEALKNNESKKTWYCCNLKKINL